MARLLLIGLFGMIGTLSRYWLSGVIARRFGETYPTGTMMVNIVGCFLAGFLFYLMQERFLVDHTIRIAVLIGLLGGFTTFSSFALQTLTLVRDGELFFALLNVLVTNFACLVMVWAGYSIAKLI